jgi:hypothetical protein
MESYRIVDVKIALLNFIHKTIQEIQTELDSLGTENISKAKIAGVEGVMRNLNSIMHAINDTKSARLNYLNLTSELSGHLFDESDPFFHGYAYNVFGHGCSRPINEIEIRFRNFRNILLYKIFTDLEIYLENALISFSPALISCAIITYPTPPECIKFLDGKFSSLRSNKSKRQFLEQIRTAILIQRNLFIGSQHPYEEKWETVEFYRTNPSTEEIDYVQFNFKTLITWVDAKLKDLSCRLIFNTNKHNVNLLINFLTCPTLDIDIETAVLDIDQRNKKNLFDSFYFNENDGSINHPEILLAILSWLLERKLLESSSTDVVDWLSSIGLTKIKKYKERTVWNKITQPNWSKRILSRRLGAVLNAIFAVTPKNDITKIVDSTSEKCEFYKKIAVVHT